MPREAPLAIHWFRRDLRISDNTALHRASEAFPRVLPTYIASSWQHQHLWTGPNRQAFLCGCLEALAKNLETIGGRLIIRHGEALEALGMLVRQSGASAIYFNRDPDPFGAAVEDQLEAKCAEWGIECHGFHDVTLHHPSEVLTQSDKPYRVYTPYFRNWETLAKPPPLPKPKNLGTPSGIDSEALPGLDHWKLATPGNGILSAGERAAHTRLKTALKERIASYALQRDLPSVAGTSRLSQDLRFGLLSPRTVYARAAKARSASRSPGADNGFHTFNKELAWREFYMAILHHYPHVLEQEFASDWRGLPWDEPGENFEAWKNGETGFPIIDAGIRELRATGFMHNRVRMIVAMFLTKDLHIDWRLGEQFFMQQLTDGEIASNNGGWQWSAGTGADAAPYFRIQNPWSQTSRYDPDGKYIKTWVPELSDVEAKRFHAPPVGAPLAKGYPQPCVDHRTERNRTLAIFKKHRQQRPK